MATKTQEEMKEMVDLMSLINQLEIKASNSNVLLLHTILGYLQNKITEIDKEINPKQGG
ncbi:MAG: hypothetical protein PHU53_06345 [Thermoplasmata archaeon]|nr:hypothetical protein [Thermoplasmata archaeon]